MQVEVHCLTDVSDGGEAVVCVVPIVSIHPCRWEEELICYGEYDVSLPVTPTPPSHTWSH